MMMNKYRTSVWAIWFANESPLANMMPFKIQSQHFDRREWGAKRIVS